MIGKSVSHYKILEKLGEGGMGVVYKAEDTKLDRLVALKFLPQHLSTSEDEKKRFIHEAKAASALDHPNICTVYEIDETKPVSGEPGEGQMFIAMAYYAGETLKGKIESGPLPIDEAIEITRQITEGLARAHAKEIVHRDIKPANVMVVEDSLVKIVDFGLAKLRGRTQLTKEGSTLGTVAYMSPEQTQGIELDQRTDVWALGVVLYEMVTGKQPFQGDYDQAVMYSILNEEPEPMTGLRTGVPLELERIVGKSLAKEADERYQHMDEILVDLKSLQREIHSTQTKTKPGKTKTALRNRTYLLGSVAAFIILVLVAAFFFLPSKSVSEGRKSVAVLFFDNLSPDPENEYFSDGVSEDIRTLLSQVADLTVISRTAVIGYKNSDKPVQEIGKELRVDTILDGSVRREGNQVRIACQLMDARTAQSIWAENYDHELTNIFEVQSSVAKQVVAALKAQLSPTERSRIEKWPTQNLQAYQYLIQGRGFPFLIKEDNEKAIELFRKAIKLDPNFADAYASLARRYISRTHIGFTTAWLDSAIETSQKAIALDPELALGYYALGTAYVYKGEFGNRVLELLHKAVELNPNDSPTLNNLGVVLQRRRELDKAILYQKRAIAVMPNNSLPKSNLAAIYRWLGDFTTALTWNNQMLELNPEGRIGLRSLASTYMFQGKYKEASELCLKVLSIYPEDGRSLHLIGDVAMLMGNFAEARKYFEKRIEISQQEELDTKLHLGYTLWKMDGQNEAQTKLSQVLGGTLRAIDEGKRGSWLTLRIAAVHAIQNEREEALDWLEKAVDAGAWLSYYDRMNMPWWEPFRNEPRFKQLITRMTTQIAEMREKVKQVEMAEQ
jgi:non-specific serine/threonine protein kinase